MPLLELEILRHVQRVQADEVAIGVLSVNEYIAVALVLDRYDLIKDSCYPTMAEAVNRLGKEWFDAALRVQRLMDLGKP